MGPKGQKECEEDRRQLQGEEALVVVTFIQRFLWLLHGDMFPT